MKRPMDIAYEFIKERIMNGIFLPSQKLNESDLAKEIGVSRSTVKKALLRLEQENLVEAEDNKGAIVKSYTLEEVLNYFEIREVLEGLLIESAAQYIMEQDLVELENIFNKMNSCFENGELDEYSALNKSFHQVIYKASRNQQAVEMVNIIKSQLLRYHIRTFLVPGRTENSRNEHEDILQAMKKHDSIAASEAVRKHIANIRETIRKNYTYLM